MAFMKSGWLWRQSSFLRRWKKHWFDLWLDGGLVFYPDENRQNFEERISLKYNCMNVRTGRECGDLIPPEGSEQGSLIIVDLRDNSRLLLCAESEDDALAWKMAFLEVKHNPVYVYDPCDDHYQAVPLNAHNAMYVNPGYYGHGYGPWLNPALVRDDPYRISYGEQLALGMLAGAVTGSALSSLMWLPCWF
ncbi:pleckstrin homology domain-containing family B member 1 [Rhinophrynus dorsalis]